MDARSNDVEYCITDRDGGVVSITTRATPSGALPAWTELGHEKCRACPLSQEEHPHCPAAVAVAPLIEQVADRISTELVHVEVRTEERTVLKDTDMQAAVQSACGLLMSRSGCPALGALRRLGEFHLPFASPRETLFRVAASLALDAALRGQSRDEWVRALRDLYASLEAVNQAFARRLRARFSGDAGVNAIIKLFSLSVIISQHVDEDPAQAIEALL